MTDEEALIRAFITPEKRARYLDKLASPKKRRKFIAERLYHMGDLDPRYARKLEPGMPLVPFEERHDAHIETTYDVLRGRGAPANCHVISTNDDLDGHEMDLLSALRAIVGRQDGTLISCVPGRLGYFEGEGYNERFILERDQ
jgi:hypothetical protein